MKIMIEIDEDELNKAIECVANAKGCLEIE
jgi:hypothetical protein